MLIGHYKHELTGHYRARQRLTYARQHSAIINCKKISIIEQSSKDDASVTRYWLLFFFLIW